MIKIDEKYKAINGDLFETFYCPDNRLWSPADFKCVWEKEAKSSLSANGKIGGNKVSTERLFLYCN